MNAVNWLLLGLIVLCALCLLVIFVSHIINGEWHDADAPTYRTADSKTIDAQIKSLRRNRP